MKRILIHSLVFSPDCVSTAYLYRDIALKFSESGYEVKVITSTPHYNVLQDEILKQPLKRHFCGLFYTSKLKNIDVIHIHQKKFKKKILRIISFIYFHLIGLIICLLEKKYDVILSPSPPLSIALLNIFIAKLKGSKTVYNVQELYPDILVNEKGLKSGFIINFLKKIEKIVYNYSNAIIVIDNVIYEQIIPRINDINKLSIIPNFVDTELYKPIKNESLKIDRQLFVDNKSFKVMYAGNIGIAQDWSIFIKVALQVKEYDIEFYIVGDGVMKKHLQDEIIKNNLEKKIHLVHYQNRELMPYIISFANLHFIFMSPEYDKQGFPSKTYTILACNKPLLISSNENSPITKYLNKSNGAFIFSNEHLDARVDEIAKFLIKTHKNPLVSEGSSIREAVIESYSKNVITSKYIKLIDSIILN